MEDEITRNLQGYYVHGLKSIGYVQVHPYTPPPQRKRIPAETAAKAETSSGSNACLALGFAGLALVAAFALPFFYSRP
uniref:MAP kinase kinase kinase (EC) n=1 Tax=Ganoderma boninense TaxID=34458 RepID=A0A5K1K7D2_9APHY|nr:MAP kinase kinase kinase (EC [Ganoderma boninense]